MGASKEFLKGLLDNPNFQKWFGESVVRDAEGLPLEVYHGTRADFDAFDLGKQGSGSGLSAGGSGVYFTDDIRNAAPYTRDPKTGEYDGKVLRGFLNLRNPYTMGSGEWSQEAGREAADALTSKLKAAGHDGVIVDHAGAGNKEYIAFEPQQFKHSLNQGTFDPTDPNFLKSAGLMTAGAGAAYGLARNNDGSVSAGPGEAEAAKLPKELITQEMQDAFRRAIGSGDKRQAVKILQEAKGIEFVDSSIDRAGAHSPAGPESGSPLFDLSGTYPDDVYSHNGLRYYGTGDAQKDAEAYNLIQKASGRPHFTTTAYRAVEKNGPKEILPGDWVTLSEQYAREHGDNALGGDYKIIKKPVSAQDIWTSGDSWLEWGYHPQPERNWGTLTGENAKKSLLERLGYAGLLGAGAYGLMGGDSDANAMSYIGPKGMANLLGPDVAKSMLSEAEQLAAKGVDNEAIRQATGVFKGMDGKWRYEVDDSGARLTPWTKDMHGQSNISWDKRPGPAVAMNTEDFISHPSLERAYWPTREHGPGVFYQHVPGDPGSRYSPSQDTIYMSAQSRNADKEGMGSALHELQHAIQQREGFARGGSPSEFKTIEDPSGIEEGNRLYELVSGKLGEDISSAIGSKDKLEALRLASPEEYDSVMAAFTRLGTTDPSTARSRALDLGQPISPEQQYFNLAGEIEARDTAARMNFTPEQRKATPPDLRDNAIVRFDQSGPNEASGLMGYNAPPRFSVDPRRVAAEALQDAYSPADIGIAMLTGGGGLAARAAQGALDPFISAGMEYLPGLMRDINPVNWMTGVSRY